MKSLVRNLATITLATSAVIAPVLLSSQRAVALPPEEVLGKLGPVLVYTVVAVDEKKQQAVPLTAAVKQGGKEVNVAWVFFDAKDAQKFIDQQKADATALKAKDPKAADEQLKLLATTRVAPDSLATFYDAAIKSKQTLKIQFVPIESQMKQAMTMQKDFQGIPAYRVNFGQNRYGTSFFLSREDLQTELESLKKSQPDLASAAKIEVVPLEGLIEVLATQNGEDLKKVRLFAPLESRKLLQSILDQSQGAGKGAAPAQPAESKKKK